MGKPNSGYWQEEVATVGLSDTIRSHLNFNCWLSAIDTSVATSQDPTTIIQHFAKLVEMGEAEWDSGNDIRLPTPEVFKQKS